MSYVGNTPLTQAFTPYVDYFSGNAVATTFTLSRSVASVNQIEVIVNNVPQNPSTAYTVSNNTITFTGAPSTGTNNIYVKYTSPVTQLIAPSYGTVGPSQMISATGTGSAVFSVNPVLNGNITVNGAGYFGYTANSTVLTNPTLVGTSTSQAVTAGQFYVQSALINASSSGSADMIAYPNNYPGPASDHGWADVGFTGNTFADPNFTITGANDGYLFAGAVAGSGLGGNLVLATDSTGTFNDVVIATGSFYANAEVARFHGNVSNNGKLSIKYTTPSTTNATGALVVSGGVGIAGSVNVGGSITPAGGIVFSDYTQLNSGNSLGMRNRIINGFMQINQRAVSSTTTAGYAVDRWKYNTTNTSYGAAAYDTAGTINRAPGYLKFNTAASGLPSLSATDNFNFTQAIEGLNISDLQWGTALASPITLSFWIRVSTSSAGQGIYTGAIQNAAQNWSYVFSFNVPSASSWQYVTLTIPGPTFGTWATDNTVGMYVTFNLGAGSNFVTANANANTWVTGNYTTTDAATSRQMVLGTYSNYNITAVQVEKGSYVSQFDWRPYPTELALCQRYCWQDPNGVAGSGYVITGSTSALLYVALPVSMRAAPSFTNITNGAVDTAASSLVVASCTLNGSTTNYARITVATATSLGTAGYAAVGRNQVIQLSAEL